MLGKRTLQVLQNFSKASLKFTQSIKFTCQTQRKECHKYISLSKNFFQLKWERQGQHRNNKDLQPHKNIIFIPRTPKTVQLFHHFCDTWGIRFICLFETKCLQQMTVVMKPCITVTNSSSMIHKSYVTYVQQKLQYIQNQLKCINVLHVQCDSYEGQPAPVIPHCTLCLGTSRFVSAPQFLKYP